VKKGSQKIFPLCKLSVQMLIMFESTCCVNLRFQIWTS